MQKTAYEMRISDWSSDVCSSDLHHSDQVAAALRNSPDIGKRKRHVEEYVKRTLEAAIREYERQEAARAAHAAQASAYRPKPRAAGGPRALRCRSRANAPAGVVLCDCQPCHALGNLGAQTGDRKNGERG